MTSDMSSECTASDRAVAGEIKATHDLDLPDDLLRALGRLTVEWAYPEMLVRAMVDDLLGKDDPSDRWTGATRPISQRIADILKRDSPSNLKSICREIETITTERNRIVHAVWALDIDSGAFGQVIDIDGKRESRSVTSGDIDQVIAKVTNLSKSLSLIRWEYQLKGCEL